MYDNLPWSIWLALPSSIGDVRYVKLFRTSIRWQIGRRRRQVEPRGGKESRRYRCKSALERSIRNKLHSDVLCVGLFYKLTKERALISLGEEAAFVDSSNILLGYHFSNLLSAQMTSRMFDGSLSRLISSHNSSGSDPTDK